MSYTPGPWTAEQQKTRDGESLGWIVKHSNGRIGWSDFATARPNEGERPPHPIGGANAHLIAAAPDLADSLIELIALFDGARDLLGPDVRHKLERAEAALRKAGVK